VPGTERDRRGPLAVPAGDPEEDGSGVLGALRRASAERLSGCVRLHSGETLIGQVLFAGGAIAWATSRSQREKLGAFLWRLGHITRSQLETVSREFEAHRGKKKFGQLLEELGFLPQPVLRHCLLLHTQEAVRALLACRGARASMEPSRVDASEAINFSLEEVLPARRAAGDGGPEWSPPAEAESGHGPGAEALGPLLAIPSHVASAVVSAAGDLQAVRATRSGLDLAPLGILASALADSASRLAACGALGAARIVSVRCAQGAAAATWIDEARKTLVVVLMGDPSHQARARLAIEEALPDLRRWTTRRSAADFFKQQVEKARTPQEQLRALGAAIRLRVRELRIEGHSDQEVSRLEAALELVEDGRLSEAACALGDLGAPPAKEAD
jgi:hypothetical protein